MTLEPMTRRDLLRRGSVLAGALSVAAWGLRSGTPAAADDAVELAPARAVTYAALVAAVGSVSGNQVDATATDDASARFAAVHAAADDQTRASVDAILDAVAVAPAGGTRFADLDTDAQVRLLHALSASSDTGESATGAGAVALAALPFYPDDVDDHPPEVTV